MPSNGNGKISWADPRVIVPLILATTVWVFGVGLVAQQVRSMAVAVAKTQEQGAQQAALLPALADQVRANSEAIKTTAAAVAVLYDRQAETAVWMAGINAASASEGARIRDEVRAELRAQGLAKQEGR